MPTDKYHQDREADIWKAGKLSEYLFCESVSLQGPCGTSQPRNIFSLVENEALLDTKTTSRAQAWLSSGGQQGLRRTESRLCLQWGQSRETTPKEHSLSHLMLTPTLGKRGYYPCFTSWESWAVKNLLSDYRMMVMKCVAKFKTSSPWS